MKIYSRHSTEIAGTCITFEDHGLILRIFTSHRHYADIRVHPKKPLASLFLCTLFDVLLDSILSRSNSAYCEIVQHSDGLQSR